MYVFTVSCAFRISGAVVSGDNIAWLTQTLSRRQGGLTTGTRKVQDEPDFFATVSLHHPVTSAVLRPRRASQGGPAGVPRRLCNAFAKITLNTLQLARMRCAPHQGQNRRRIRQLFLILPENRHNAAPERLPTNRLKREANGGMPWKLWRENYSSGSPSSAGHGCFTAWFGRNRPAPNAPIRATPTLAAPPDQQLRCASPKYVASGNCVAKPSLDRLFLGVDWARISDRTIVTISNETNDVIDWLKYEGMPYHQQVELIRADLERPRRFTVADKKSEFRYVDRILAIRGDAMGVAGAAPNEMLQLHSGLPVGPDSFFKFTVQSKDALDMNFEQPHFRDEGIRCGSATRWITRSPPSSRPR
jgi:hypothetical protein